MTESSDAGARLAAGVLAAGLTLAAAQVGAAPISIDFSGGDPPPGESFTWQGLEFSLDPQPGGSVNPAHRVVGDSEGAIDIFLEEPGKVTYKAQLAEPTKSLQRVDIDWVYGAGLDDSTPAFSFIQPFLRTFDGSGPSTAVEGLGGSDEKIRTHRSPASVRARRISRVVVSMTPISSTTTTWASRRASLRWSTGAATSIRV